MAVNVSNHNPYILKNGKKIPVTKRGDSYYYQFEGKTYRVDKNAILQFGQYNGNTTTNELAQKAHERYENCVEKIKEIKKQDKGLISRLKSAKTQFTQYLTSIGVRTMSEITNKSQLAQAKEYQSSVSGLKSQHMRNGFDIISTAHEGVSAALSEGRLVNQAYVEHINLSA